MKRKIKHTLFFLCLCPIIGFAQTNSFMSKQKGSRATDSLSLVHFADATNCKQWKVKWDFEKPMSEWYGVGLNSFGRVFCLDLDGVTDCKSTKNGGNLLTGNLPELDLHFLEHLFLSSNRITGAIPSFKGAPNLLTLQLSGNKLLGQIPDFKDNLKLTKLDLEYNLLSGDIPDFELNNLQTLYLGHNQLSGYLPSFENVPQLKHLFVNNNQLNGGLPHFAHLVQLTHFIFKNNKFEGPLPHYFKLAQLSILNGENNALEGCCKKIDYVSLRYLNLTNNNLKECDLEGVQYIPKAFSPNADGVNDYFEIKLEMLASDITLSLVIYNTEGRIIYFNENYKGDWKGTFEDGSNAPEGLYIVHLKHNNQDYKGTVYLKR